jgi:UDP-galactopyranose mutase
MAIADQFDAIVVGAGLSGAVMAERLATERQMRVWVIDNRSHIGGNVHDGMDPHGIMVHTYGPHLFHTDNEAVWNYLSRFTEWIPYQHRVLAYFDGTYTPIPFNFDSIRKHFPDAEALIHLLKQQYAQREKVPILELMQSEQPRLRELAQFVYEKIFLQYTSKQWGVRPEEISPEVTGRVPVLLGEHDGYFTDRYQAIPSQGYAAMVGKMLANPLISVTLDQSAGDLITLGEDHAIWVDGEKYSKPVIYTGMIDELFAYSHGELPYRSLKFESEHHAVPRYQPSAVVNYTASEAFTRITEFKQITSQQASGTTIFKEYPGEYSRSSTDFNIPYYPKFTEQAQAKYEAYKAQAKGYANLHLCGRLATYRYLDMDDAVANALELFDTHFPPKRQEAEP